MANLGKGRTQALAGDFELRDSYRIKRVLGEGGFGITYLASHIGLDHPVAIKEYLPAGAGVRADDGIAVLPKFGKEEEFHTGLARFADEARTLATFNHPGIVSVSDIFKANGTAYMIMEYVEGESLATRIRSADGLEEASLRAILAPILDALEEIHARGILHRDLKPDNIHLRENGCPVLLDFGNSRRIPGRKSKGLTVTLTPGFAPPEQYSTNGKQGPWTDIYALGATLYLAITGIDPPEAPDRTLDDLCVPAREAARRIYSPELLAAIDRALVVKPSNRPKNIAEFRCLLDGPSASYKTVLPARRMKGIAMNGPPNGRWRVLWPALRRAVTAVIFAAVVGAGYWTWTEYRQAEAQRIATVRAREAVERTRRLEVQRREMERWKQAVQAAEKSAKEAARRAAAEAARRRAAIVARRKAAEVARRQIEREAQRRARVVREQVAGRPARRGSSPKEEVLLGGVWKFLGNLLP